jgi:hypothetical protein
MFDSDPHDEVLGIQEGDIPTPTPTLTPDTVNVMDQADLALGIMSPPRSYYTPRIQDSTTSLINPEPSEPQNVETDGNTYSIRRYDTMLLVGERVDNSDSSFKHYKCCFVQGCIFTCQDPISLLDHFSAYHTLLERLPGSPLRLVCPYCDKFYRSLEERCSNNKCLCPLPLEERVYGEFNPFKDSLFRGTGGMHAGVPGTDTFAQGGNLQQSADYGWGPSLISPNQFTDVQRSGRFSGGSSMNNSGWGWGYTAPCLQLGISTCIASQSNCLRTIGELTWVRRYSFVFAFATLLSLLINLQSYVCVKISFSHIHTLLTSQNASVIGLAVMSFAFCVHRLLQFALSADGNIPVLQRPLVDQYSLNKIHHSPYHQTPPPYPILLSDHERDFTQPLEELP